MRYWCNPAFYYSWFLLLFGIACSESVKETPSGMKFQVVVEGDGKLPRPGEIVAFNFRLIDSDDSVWRDTYKESFPHITKIGDSSRISSERGLDQLIRMSSYGDSMVVQMSMLEYFNTVLKRPIPAHLDTSRRLTYSVRIDSVLSLKDYRAWITGYRNTQNSIQLAKDGEIIDEHLAANGIKAQKSESGLRYVVEKEGTGSLIVSGQTVQVNYTGYLLNGTVFATSSQQVAKENRIYDPNFNYKPKAVTVDQSTVIPGWHEALKLLKENSRASFYMPSPLGYGPEKLDTLINENEILVFDIEILKKDQ
jgi:FKBP-type peptidyl-prolyl cis-trans isomerase FkpA